MEFAFADFQGFLYNNNVFHFKEICILTKNIKFHEFVKPPLPFYNLTAFYRKQAQWLEEEFHGLNWDTGYITQQELINTILPILKFKIVFLKGANKIKWMDEILQDKSIICINIEDIGCDLKLSKKNVDDQSVRVCAKHKHAHSCCARVNALLLKKWFFTNFGSKLNCFNQEFKMLKHVET